MATQNQITFIVTNKYYKVAWVTKVNLTFEDAEKMCENISPYSDGNCNYYYRIRTKKEIWLPRLLSVLVSMAEKYGVEEYSKEYEQELSKFNLTLERKRMREELKMLQQKEEQRKREIDRYYQLGLVVNTTNGNRLPLAGTYLDGRIEELSAEKGNDIPDMVFLSEQVSEASFNENTSKYCKVTNGGVPYCLTPLYVEDLDVFAYLVHSPIYKAFGAPIGLIFLKEQYDNGEFGDAYDKHIKSWLGM